MFLLTERSKGDQRIMKNLLLLLILLLSGCAVTQEITFQDRADDQEYGEIVVQFSDNIKNVRATLDDRLVDAERRLTKEMRLYNIPPGDHILRISAASWELKEDVNFQREITVQPGQQSAVIVSVPPKSGGYWAFQAVTYVTILSLSLRYAY